MKTVSLMMLTIDRYDITKQCLDHNMQNTGLSASEFNLELLVADNGSTDERIIKYIQQAPCLTYHRVNARNEGVGRAFNQLELRATGDYLVFLGNDIKLPKGWLAEAIRYLDAVPKSGIAGFDWGHGGVPTCEGRDFGGRTIIAHWLTPKLNRVFGVWVMRRGLVDHLGLFPELYEFYGLEDSNFNERVNRAGYNSFYIPNMKSEHLCNDVGNGTSYRAMKDRSMSINLGLFAKDVQRWEAGGELVEATAVMRIPLQ